MSKMMSEMSEMNAKIDQLLNKNPGQTPCSTSFVCIVLLPTLVSNKRRSSQCSIMSVYFSTELATDKRHLDSVENYFDEFCPNCRMSCGLVESDTFRTGLNQLRYGKFRNTWTHLVEQMFVSKNYHLFLFRPYLIDTSFLTRSFEFFFDHLYSCLVPLFLVNIFFLLDIE